MSMDQTNLEMFRTTLEAKRKFLQEQGARKLAEVRTRGLEHGDHVCMNGAASYNSRLSAECIADINAALARIDRGEFGICATCRREIDKERLDFMPYAKHCTACQSQKGVKIY